MSPLDWLDQESGIVRPEGHLPYLTTKPTRLEILAELIYVNEGTELNGIGVRRRGCGVYGRIGLEPQEAILFVHSWSYLNGMLYDKSPTLAEGVQIKIHNEINRVTKLYESAIQLPLPGETLAINKVGINENENEILKKCADGKTYKASPGGILLG